MNKGIGPLRRWDPEDLNYKGPTDGFAFFDVNPIHPEFGTKWLYEVRANNWCRIKVLDNHDEARLLAAKLNYERKEDPRSHKMIGLDGIEA